MCGGFDVRPGGHQVQTNPLEKPHSPHLCPTSLCLGPASCSSVADTVDSPTPVVHRGQDSSRGVITQLTDSYLPLHLPYFYFQFPFQDNLEFNITGFFGGFKFTAESQLTGSALALQL